MTMGERGHEIDNQSTHTMGVQSHSDFLVDEPLEVIKKMEADPNQCFIQL